jgi:hypothetical protein
MRDRMGIIGEHTITINGRELPAAAWKPLRIYDQNNIAANISPFIKNGVNVMDVSVTVAADWHGLSDPMYLLGDFGVFKREGKLSIEKAPATVLPRAGAVEGFPFYSGRISFETGLRAENPAGYRFFTVEFPEKYRIYECVELSVNGRDLGVRTFSPYIWQGSADMLANGMNAVTLRVVNTLGNMLEGCHYDYEAQRTVGNL